MDGSYVDSHKQSYYAQFYDIDGADPQIYWNKCACNESDALVRRHCIPRIPTFDVNNPAIKSLRSRMLLFADNVKPWLKAHSSIKSVVLNSRPSVRGRYKRAYRDLVYKRLYIDDVFSKSTAFVKFEKIPMTKYEEGKSPRLIQYRSFEYLLLLKSCLKPFSDAIKEGNVVNPVNGQNMSSIFTKTMTPRQIAVAMKESWDSFAHPVGVCLDHSKFDGHYDELLLESEHAMWLHMFNNKKLLKRLLNCQINNKGRTQNKLTYFVKGTRLSGEFTTSDGNTTTNINMIEQWLGDSEITNYRLHVNGDDSVVIIDIADLDKLLPLTYFNNFNMETELEGLAYDFRQITYCQSSPIRIQGEWLMVKNPKRTLSRISYADSKYVNCRERYLLGTNLCELAVSSGVPMIQSFCLRNLSNKARPLGSVDKTPAKIASQESLMVRPINDQTRDDFHVAFGISKVNQILFETWMAGETNELALINIERYKNFHLQ